MKSTQVRFLCLALPSTVPLCPLCLFESSSGSCLSRFFSFDAVSPLAATRLRGRLERLEDGRWVSGGLCRREKLCGFCFLMVLLPAACPLWWPYADLGFDEAGVRESLQTLMILGDCWLSGLAVVSGVRFASRLGTRFLQVLGGGICFRGTKQFGSRCHCCGVQSSTALALLGGIKKTSA